MKSRSHERGMITVEAVLSLVPFILLVMGIISFINIFMVHNKIQYALFQSASELSAYTYFYEAFGIRAADLNLKTDIDNETTEIDASIDSMKTLIDQMGELSSSWDTVKDSDASNIYENITGLKDTGKETVDAGKQAAEDAIALVSDPKELLKNVVYYGIEKAEAKLKELFLSAVESLLLPTYLNESFLSENPKTADEYLKSFGVVDGVKGLKFTESSLFTDDKYSMIDIVVEYDMELTFFQLFLKDPKIHVVQRCAVPAWLDGDGKHYKQ